MIIFLSNETENNSCWQNGMIIIILKKQNTSFMFRSNRRIARAVTIGVLFIFGMTSLCQVAVTSNSYNLSAAFSGLATSSRGQISNTSVGQYAGTQLKNLNSRPKNLGLSVLSTVVRSGKSSGSQPATFQMKSATTGANLNPAPPVTYDEQMGTTFTQSFTSMHYTVSASEQQDGYGYGTAFILNGLSDMGYWYQVGLVWNWPYANGGYDPGFNVAYEVWDSNGFSVYPSQGGGLLSFSNSVFQGDTIGLNLYFSSGNVVMSAFDYNTSASAQQAYSADGATSFVGLPNSPASQIGYFTGLMTEQYHVNPYYGNEPNQMYSDPSFAISSAWMWAEEFNFNNFSDTQFASVSNSPVDYSSPKIPQYFSTNGTTEASDAYFFMTGSATFVLLTLSYSLHGAGSITPTLDYTYDGVQQDAQVSTSPTTFRIDTNTSWSLPSKNISPSERWAVVNSSSGIATTSEAMSVDYYHQFLVNFSSDIQGGGSGYSSPTVSYTEFGSPNSTSTGQSVWCDAGSPYSYQNKLGGSSASERWESSVGANGTILSANTINMTYYHQYLVDFGFSVSESTSSPPQINYFSVGSPQTVQASKSVWVDAESKYSYQTTLSNSNTNERWVAAASSQNGTVTTSESLKVPYYHQYYVAFNVSSPTGGSISLQSGWYNASSTLKVSASSSSGWQFEQWIGGGTSSYSGNDVNPSITINASITENALFYPGLVISSSGGGSVLYSYGSTSANVQNGKSVTLYLPIGTSVHLSASPSPILNSFNHWSGGVSGNSLITSLTVSAPSTVAASFSYNFLNIGIIALVVIALLSAVLLVRRKRRGPGSPPVQQS